MKTSHKHRYHVAIIALCLIPLTACATLVGLPTEGQVLEEGTNQPIADAIVIVRWAGVLPTLGHARSTCTHVESATTDQDGRYRTNAWRAPSLGGAAPLTQANIAPGAYAYKSGYEYVGVQEGVVVLKPFGGGRKERLEYLRRASWATRCSSAGESKKNALPLARALYEEARDLASSKEERAIVDNLLFSLETIELGYEKAEKRDIERDRGGK